MGDTDALKLVDDDVYKELMRVQAELQRSERYCLRCLAQLEAAALPLDVNNALAGDKAPPERASNANKRFRTRATSDSKGIEFDMSYICELCLYYCLRRQFIVN